MLKTEENNYHKLSMNKNKLRSARKELLDYAKHASWYHTIRISNNIKTAGVYDHEKFLPKYGFPKSLKGKTVLDVGCADGFFAFEFEKKGAQSVLAVDTNKFDGRSAISSSLSGEEKYRKKYQEAYLKNNKFVEFAQKLGLGKVHHLSILKKLLNSNIQYKDLSIYDLQKENKKFDFVFCGSLIEHLKNPIEAIEQLRLVCRDTCIISLSNPLILPYLFRLINIVPNIRNRLLVYHGDSGGTFFWFYPETFKRLLLDCGFKDVRIYSKFRITNEKYKHKISHVVYHCKV